MDTSSVLESPTIKLIVSRVMPLGRAKGDVLKSYASEVEREVAYFQRFLQHAGCLSVGEVTGRAD